MVMDDRVEGAEWSAAAVPAAGQGGVLVNESGFELCQNTKEPLECGD